MKYGTIEEILNYIKGKEEIGEYFLVSVRGDKLGYVLTRAAPPEKRGVIRKLLGKGV